MESRPGARRPVARALVALLFVLVLAEVALHVFPGVLPERYLERFPMRGVEFFRPGILAETAIGELPFPLRRSYVGPPPADMQAWGLAPPDVDLDRRKYPRIVLPADQRGLPNERVLERADILFVGDSFVVGTASTDPPGLQADLAGATGKTIYNLGVAGVGARHGLWLLEEVGMDLRPRLVLWFFYAGNDLVDERKLLDLEAAGVETHADKDDYRPPPRLRLLSLVRELTRSPEPARAAPLPGFPLPLPAGERHPLWFLADNLWRLSLDRTGWEGHRGWPSTRASLVRARDVAREGGARLVIVYLPSKAQVYWPFVERDPALLRRYIEWGMDVPLDFEPAKLVDDMLANRNELEALLASFCDAEGIAFFSARPPLEARASRGELVFLSVDSHWDGAGQAAVLAPLVELLSSTELLTAR